MPDISKLKIGLNIYNIKDSDARSKAEDARSKAEDARSKADTATSNVDSLKTKINGLKLNGTYTSATETIELLLN